MTREASRTTVGLSSDRGPKYIADWEHFSGRHVHSADFSDTALAALGDLPGVVLGVDKVKLEPLIDGQGAEDRVVEHFSGAE